MSLGFLVGAGGLLALAVLLLIWPLLRQRRSALRSQRALNIALYRERIAELEQERLAGLIEPEHYDQARLELEAALVADVDDQPNAEPVDTQSASSPTRGAMIGLITVALMVPVAALIIHTRLYEPLPVASVSEPSTQALAQSEEMRQLIAQLDERMRENPEDGRGWLLLAQSNRIMGDYASAIDAFEQALQRLGEEPDVLVQFSDAVIMQAGGMMTARASGLIERALSVDPNHLDALWLAGVGAFQTETFERAVLHWGRLHAQLEPGSEASIQVGEALDTARLLATGLGEAPETARDETVLAVTVELAPDLGGTLRGDEAVLVFARDADGPPMPIAARRLNVNQLPAVIRLDANASMIPERTLDSVDAVQLVARISRSGGVEPQSGDLEGRSEPIRTGQHRTIQLVIDRELP